MEGEKKESSFVNDLFGPKENPSALVYDAIYRPSYKVRESSEKNGSASQPENGVADQNGVGVGQGTANKYNQGEIVHVPFHYHYSSSIYYGGPDLISPPQPPAPSPFFTTFKKDGEDDESGYATRGDWWMGSLYY